MDKPDPKNIIYPSGFLAIDPAFGLDVLSQYCFELHQIQSGVPFKDLGIGDRRAASNVSVIEVAGEGNDVTTQDKFAVVNLSGLIQAQDGMSSIGTARMADQLLAEKNNVIGALIKINSGGGYMDGAEIMSSALKEFGKPTVTVSNYAGSAAYQIASSTDQILAMSKFSSFGSIGVYYELNKEFRDMYKNFIETAYSEDSPDKNAEWRAYLNGDLSGFVKLATQKDQLFMADVTRKRRLRNYAKMNETLRGGMFQATDALERGLIDGFGNNTTAFSIIKKLSK